MNTTAQSTTVTELKPFIHPFLMELFVAELGFQLANRKLQNKEMVPTLQGMRTGITSLIPGFNSHFAKATLDENKDIIWPEGKVGLVEGSFDYFEKQSTIALNLISSLSPQALKDVAYMVHGERVDRGGIAYPPKYADTLAEMLHTDQLSHKDVLEELKHWLCSKVIYVSMMGMSVIRENGYNASFNPRTYVNKLDINKFMECQINHQVEDVAEKVDHPEDTHVKGTDMSDDVSPWDIKSIIDSNVDVFDLPEDAYHQTCELQKAAVNFNSWFIQCEDHGSLLDEALEESRARTKEFLDSRRKASAQIDAVAVKKK